MKNNKIPPAHADGKEEIDDLIDVKLAKLQRKADKFLEEG